MQQKKPGKFYIIPLILSIAVLFSTTYAWYVNTKEVGIGTDGNVSIAVDISGLEISTDGTHFSTNLNLTSNLSLVDVTGDGINFLYPNALGAGDTSPAEPGAYLELNNTNKDGKIIEFDLTFRTKQKITIYLSAESYVRPSSYNYDSAKDLASIKAIDAITRKSSGGGNFSADCIAGCARIAFNDVTGGVETLQNLWVPNPYIHLHKETGTEVSNTCNMNGDMEAFQSALSTTKYTDSNPFGYVYLDKNGAKPKVSEKIYTKAEYASKLITVGKYLKAQNASLNPQLATDGTINNAKSLLAFEGSSTPTLKKIKVRIWFEGTDREADRLLNGGLVSFNLRFVGFDKPAPSDDLLTKLNAIKLQNGKLTYGGTDVATSSEKYQFTRNGYYWWDYSSTSQVNAGDYVRLKETDKTLPSEAVLKN